MAAKGLYLRSHPACATPSRTWTTTTPRTPAENTASSRSSRKPSPWPPQPRALNSWSAAAPTAPPSRTARRPWSSNALVKRAGMTPARAIQSGTIDQRRSAGMAGSDRLDRQRQIRRSDRRFRRPARRHHRTAARQVRDEGRKSHSQRHGARRSEVILAPDLPAVARISDKIAVATAPKEPFDL